MYCLCSHLCSYGILVSLTLHSLCSSYVHDSYNIPCLSYVPLVFSPFIVCLLLTVFHYSISFSAILSFIWWHILSGIQWSYVPLNHMSLLYVTSCSSIVPSYISLSTTNSHFITCPLHGSVPAGLWSTPIAHPSWHALLSCCDRFDVLSGLVLPCCSMKRGRASALRRSTVRHTSQRRSALLIRAAEEEARSPYPSTRSRGTVRAAVASHDVTAALGIATTSMTDMVALVSREVLKQLRDECDPTSTKCTYPSLVRPCCFSGDAAPLWGIAKWPTGQCNYRCT